jgi:DNA-binding protein HU-beta
MTKDEFVEHVAAETGMSKSDASKAVAATLAVIEGTLKRGGEVSFTGFGKFSVAERSARRGVNPQTGEQIEIAGGFVPRFSAGSALKRAIGSEGGAGARRSLSGDPDLDYGPAGDIDVDFGPSR